MVHYLHFLAGPMVTAVGIRIADGPLFVPFDIPTKFYG